MNSHIPQIIADRITSTIASLSDNEFKAFLDGVKAAHTAAVFSIGTFGSDVIAGVKRFEKDAVAIRRRKP